MKTAYLVATVRFNNFSNHGGLHTHLELSKQEVIDFYINIKDIHSKIKMSFQLAISEDFGTDGIKVMEFPDHVGWCRAGHQLFTVIPTEEKPVFDVKSKEHIKTTKIGDIVACVNIFEPHCGELIRYTDTKSNNSTYKLQFNTQVIDRFNQSRLKGDYKNGCFAKELREEKSLVLTPQLQAKLKKAQSQITQVDEYV